MSKFRYVLRYYIDMDFHEDARIAELVQMCKSGSIDEVMFFFNPEELFQCLVPEIELEKWFALAEKLKSALTAAHIDISINPWTTTVHLSRGRKFSGKTLRYSPLVGENGVVSAVTSCPLDKNWIADLSAFWARIARDIAPTAIWVEDDWRLHNHEPSMNYGGCFCTEHLARFEAAAGTTTNRETLLQNITAPGTPHPWRKIWLDICRDTLLEPARQLYRTVHNANPDVRLGLMSSQADIHSIEGRDWNELKQALSPDKPLLLRPHLPPYTEVYALQALPSNARQTISEFHEGIEIYPELENSPRSGRYSKSGSFSIWECVHSALFGAHGITINHYDMMGNGLALDKSFPAALEKAKPFLDALCALELDDANSEGVNVIYSPRVAEVMHSRKENTLYGLMNNSISWSNVCYTLGISHRISREICDRAVNAVSGETLRAFSDEQIVKLLQGGVLLDACSGEILLERGFGARIGFTGAPWTTLDQSGYAYEEIMATRERMTAQRCSMRLLQLDSLPTAREVTSIMRYDRTRMCPGALYFRNEWGGTVLTVAYPLEESQFSMGYYNNFRRIFMQRMILELNNQMKIAMGTEDPLFVYRNKCKSGTLIAIMNPTHDNYDQISLRADDLIHKSVEQLTAQGQWVSAVFRLADKQLIFDYNLAPLGTLVLRFS